jgi:hypothetical protein
LIKGPGTADAIRKRSPSAAGDPSDGHLRRRVPQAAHARAIDCVDERSSARAVDLPEAEDCLSLRIDHISSVAAM